MLKVERFEEHNGGFELVYSYDDINGEVQKAGMKFKEKKAAYKFYSNVLWHYSIQCFDKVRQTADQVAIKYPEWMDGLIELDYGKLTELVIKKSKEFDYKTANEEVKNYLSITINNAIYAVTELQKLVQKKLT